MSGVRLRLGALALVALAQLAVPVSMIVGLERTLRDGTVWRFRTAPVDPADAFRGRYVALAFEETRAPLAPGLTVERGDSVWVGLSRDAAGFAVLGPVRASRPPAGDALRLRVAWVETAATPPLAHLDLPFDRLYLVESSAPRAERVYRESQRGGEGRRPAWAVVRVRDGKAALEDVLVEGRSLRELARTGGRER